MTLGRLPELTREELVELLDSLMHRGTMYAEIFFKSQSEEIRAEMRRRSLINQSLVTAVNEAIYSIDRQEAHVE